MEIPTHGGETRIFQQNAAHQFSSDLNTVQSLTEPDIPTTSHAAEERMAHQVVSEAIEDLFSPN